MTVSLAACSVSGSVCYHNTAKPQARNPVGHAVKGNGENCFR
jgi:hypothetical protein